MNYYVQLFWRIFIRKETPASVPSSLALMLIIILLTFFVSLIASVNAPDGIIKNIAGNLIDLIVLALFSHFLLDFYKRRPRFLQTFIALLGIKLVFQMLTVPGILYLSTIENIREPNALAAFISIFILVLLVVTLRAIAQVFAFALEISGAKAILFSFLYYMINLFITIQLFADQQTPSS